MTHPFHIGRDARYTGAATIPNTSRRPAPAAALVLHHTRAVEIAPMFRALDNPEQRGVASVRLVPITVHDFYGRRDALPDLYQLGSEEHPTGDPQGAASDLRARPAVAVPAPGGNVPRVQGSASGGDGGAVEMEGAR